MAASRFKLNHLQVLQFAVMGVDTAINQHMGKKTWTAAEWEFHAQAKRELERRVKIMVNSPEKK
jgi:hypothetical protein